MGSSTVTPSCLIRFQGKTGEVSKLTCHTLVKIKEHCQKWINLEGEPKGIAEKIIDVVRSWPDSEPDVLPRDAADFFYHKECYIRFCDKNKVARANKKKEKVSTQDLRHQGIPETHLEKRSSARISSIVSASTSTERRSIHILPVQCIVCKRKDAYVMDKVLFSSMHFFSP